MEYGFEFVDAEAKGKNDFGENTGLERLREALEANDWSAAVGDDEADEVLEGFDAEEREMNSELWGLKASLLGIDNEVEDGERSMEQDEANQVDGLEHLMSQALAIRGSYTFEYCAWIQSDVKQNQERTCLLKSAKDTPLVLLTR